MVGILTNLMSILQSVCVSVYVFQLVLLLFNCIAILILAASCLDCIIKMKSASIIVEEFFVHVM